jgi:hypothetical protein
MSDRFHKYFLFCFFRLKLCNWIQNSNYNKVELSDHIICNLLVYDVLYVIILIMTPCTILVKTKHSYLRVSRHISWSRITTGFLNVPRDVVLIIPSENILRIHAYTGWLPVWLYAGSLAEDKVMHLFEIEFDLHIICSYYIRKAWEIKHRYVTVGSCRSHLLVVLIHIWVNHWTL